PQPRVSGRGAGVRGPPLPRTAPGRGRGPARAPAGARRADPGRYPAGRVARGAGPRGRTAERKEPIAMTEASLKGLPSTDAPGSIVSSVAAALARVLGRDAATVTPSSRLFDDLGLDSTSVLELLLELEDELGVEFDADTLEQHHF